MLERRYREKEHQPRSASVLKRVRLSACSADNLRVSRITEDQAPLRAFPQVALAMNALTAL